MKSVAQSLDLEFEQAYTQRRLTILRKKLIPYVLNTIVFSAILLVQLFMYNKSRNLPLLSHNSPVSAQSLIAGIAVTLLLQFGLILLSRKTKLTSILRFGNLVAHLCFDLFVVETFVHPLALQDNYTDFSLATGALLELVLYNFCSVLLHSLDAEVSIGGIVIYILSAAYLYERLEVQLGLIFSGLAFGLIVLYVVSLEKKVFFAQYTREKQSTVYESFLNLLPEGVAIINEDETLKYVNNSMHRILDCERNMICERILSLQNIDLRDDPNQQISSNNQSYELVEQASQNNVSASSKPVLKDFQDTQSLTKRSSPHSNRSSHALNLHPRAQNNDSLSAEKVRTESLEKSSLEQDASQRVLINHQNEELVDTHRAHDVSQHRPQRPALYANTNKLDVVKPTDEVSPDKLSPLLVGLSTKPFSRKHNFNFESTRHGMQKYTQKNSAKSTNLDAGSGEQDGSFIGHKRLSLPKINTLAADTSHDPNISSSKTPHREALEQGLSLTMPIPTKGESEGVETTNGLMHQTGWALKRSATIIEPRTGSRVKNLKTYTTNTPNVSEATKSLLYRLSKDKIHLKRQVSSVKTRFLSRLCLKNLFNKQGTSSPKLKELVSNGNQRLRLDKEDYCVQINSSLRLDSTNKRHLEVKLSPTLLYNESCIMVLIKDTTERDIFNRLKETNSYKNTLMASVSHELRTPLNCIISMLEMLGECVEEELLTTYLHPALNSSKLLLSLVNDILDFAQIRAGRLRLIDAEFSLQNTLKEALALFDIPTKNRGIDMHFEYDEDIKANFCSDSNRVRQVVINLIGNAIKFTYEGSITLKASSLPSDRVKISVVDTGIGIKPEDLKKLFSAFGKIQNDQMNPQGVGLGLLISQSLAKRLGPVDNSGIEIASTPGEGSTFSFLIESHHKDQSLPDDRPSDVSTYSCDINNVPEYDTSRVVTNMEALTNKAANSEKRMQVGFEQFRTKKSTKDLSPMLIDSPLLSKADFTTLTGVSKNPKQRSKESRRSDITFSNENHTVLRSDLSVPLDGLDSELKSFKSRDHLEFALPENSDESKEGHDSLVQKISVDAKKNKAATHPLESNEGLKGKKGDLPRATTENLFVPRGIEGIHRKISSTRNLLHSYHEKTISSDKFSSRMLESNAGERPFGTTFLQVPGDGADQEPVTMLGGIKETNAESAMTSNYQITPSSRIQKNAECKCPKILVVDDNDFNLLALRQLLSSLGCHIATAHNGQLAIDQVMKRANQNCCSSYRVIFMDCDMPVKNGFEAAQELKQLQKDNMIPPVPIVATTAYVSQREIKKCYDSGMDDYLNKPVMKEKLKEILSKWFEPELVIDSNSNRSI